MEIVDPFEKQRREEEEEKRKKADILDHQPEIRTPELPLEQVIPNGNKKDVPPFPIDIEELIRQNRKKAWKPRIGNA